MDKRCVVVIDPYLTGAKIVQEVKRLGLQCVGIMTWENVPSFAKSTYPGDVCDRTLHWRRSEPFSKLIQCVDGLSVVAVLPGTEVSVDLAERLRFELGLPTNHPDSSSMRRNKYQMHQALKKRGLSVPSQILAASINDVCQWLDSDDEIVWPVVVKPVDSAGTDGLSFCHTRDEVIAAWHRLMGSSNLFGMINRYVLVQSFLRGTEYVVNTVTWNGVHKITDFWRYHKRPVVGSGAIYDWQELLPIGQAETLGLKDYALSALDALNVEYGPSHCEIMLTDQGPRLVEIASRIQGGINMDVLNGALGNNQLSITLQTYLDPTSFDELTLPDRELKRHALWVNLIAENDSVVKEIDGFESAVKRLNSYASFHASVSEGATILKTIDLNTSPGVVFLSHPENRQVMSDYQAIRDLEKLCFIPRSH